MKSSFRNHYLKKPIDWYLDKFSCKLELKPNSKIKNYTSTTIVGFYSKLDKDIGEYTW